MKSLKAAVAVALSAAAFLSCDNIVEQNPVEPETDPQLALSPDSIVVEVYKASSLTATVRDASGAIQPVAALQYISRDPNVATVNAFGAISAMAAGSTYLVATLQDRPNVRDSIRVRVYADSCSGTRPDFGGMATAADRALFAYDVNAPLNLQKTIESSNDGVEVSSISFSSPDGGSVTGLMWDPVTRSGLRPGMVLMHGLPGNASVMSGMGQTYAQSGAVVIAIDAPWNHRTGPPLTITEQDRGEQIQVIKDLQRAVDVLYSYPNVDVNRIAFMGGSWGGATGALFVGIEQRLRTAVLFVGHGGQVSHHTGLVGHKLLSPYPCAKRLDWIRAMAPVEPIRFVGNANVPLLLQNGKLDHLVPVYEAEELHNAAPQPKEVRWYDAGHGLNQQAGFDRYDWLHTMIGIDAR